MNSYIYDIEAFINYFLVIFYNIQTQKFTIFELNQRHNQLRELVKFLEQVDTLIGFNSKRYDDLVLKYILHNDCLVTNKDLYNLTKALIEKDIAPEFRVKYQDFLNNKYYKNPWRLSIDLMNFYRKISLKGLAVALGHKVIQELPYKPDEPLTDEMQEKVKAYCFNDVDITHKVYEEVKPKLKLRKYLEKDLKEEIRALNHRKKFETLPDSQLAADIMALKYCSLKSIGLYDLVKLRKPDYSKIKIAELIVDKIEFITQPLKDFLIDLKNRYLEFEEIEIPTFQGDSFSSVKLKKTSEFKIAVMINGSSYAFGLGGLHSEASSKVYNSQDDGQIIDVDVVSYYPSLIINHRIKPDFLGDEWIEIYKDITQERLLAKKQGDKLKSEALKIIINSLYGNFNYPYFYAYDPKTQYTVTLNGQLYLLMLIERLELAGYKVISANTDGVTFLNRVGFLA